MASPLAGNTMVYGLLFGVNEVIASSQQFNKNNPWHHVFGGFMSGSIQCVVGTPSELSKIRMQVHRFRCRAILFEISFDFYFLIAFSFKELGSITLPIKTTRNIIQIHFIVFT